MAVLIDGDSAVIGLEGTAEQDFYETTVLVDLLHIVRLEPLGVAAGPGNGEGAG